MTDVLDETLQDHSPEIVPTEVAADDVVTFQFPRPEKKRVAIVGFATGHSHLAPYDDPETEIWGINQLWKQHADKRFTRWFELHDLDKFYRTNMEHRAFLKAFDGPVYVREQDYALALEWGIENAQPFPHNVLTAQFLPYFNNTISWLIALAILMSETDRGEGGAGFEWMGLFGVDMAQDSMLQAEYSQQRPSCEYFIGIATGRGIEVFMPDGADLLKATHLYGYEDSGPVLEKMVSRYTELGQMKEQVRGQLLALQQQAKALEGQLSQFDGAMQEVTYWRKNWLTLPPTDLKKPDAAP